MPRQPTSLCGPWKPPPPPDRTSLFVFLIRNLTPKIDNTQDVTQALGDVAKLWRSDAAPLQAQPSYLFRAGFAVFSWATS
jgi:hypothetical protein